MANLWFDLLRSSGSIGTGGGTGVSALFNNQTGGTTLKPKKKRKEKPFRGVLIRKMPAKDRRYTVTKKDVKRMQDLYSKGMTQADIWRLFNKEGIPVSRGIVQYWTNEESRTKQREKNAKRRYVPGSAEHAHKIQRDMDKRRENWKADPEMKLRHNLQAGLNEKRSKVYSVQGMPAKEARELLESGKLQRKNRKID